MSSRSRSSIISGDDGSSVRSGSFVGVSHSFNPIISYLFGQRWRKSTWALHKCKPQVDPLGPWESDWSPCFQVAESRPSQEPVLLTSAPQVTSASCLSNLVSQQYLDIESLTVTLKSQLNWLSLSVYFQLSSHCVKRSTLFSLHEYEYMYPCYCSVSSETLLSPVNPDIVGVAGFLVSRHHNPSRDDLLWPCINHDKYYIAFIVYGASYLPSHRSVTWLRTMCSGHCNLMHSSSFFEQTCSYNIKDACSDWPL